MSGRANPWSFQEQAKAENERLVKNLISNKLFFDIKTVIYPLEDEYIFCALLEQLCDDEWTDFLIIDVSTIPRTLSKNVYETIYNYNLRGNGIIYFVYTLPERYTHDQGLGPYEVGTLHIPSNVSGTQVSAIVFPGFGGYEAKNAFDMLSELHSDIMVAWNCFEPDYLQAYNYQVGNYAIFDEFVNKRAHMTNYFSYNDALRVFEEFFQVVKDRYDNDQTSKHSAIFAMFSYSWTYFLAAFTMQRIKNISDSIRTHMVFFPVHQYQTMYSHGVSQSIAFCIEDE